MRKPIKEARENSQKRASELRADTGHEQPH